MGAHEFSGTTGDKQPLVIREGEWAELQRRVTAPTTSVRDARRARIVLVAAAGASLESVAERVGCSKRAVGLWRGRYEGQGIAGLADVPGRGRKPSLETEKVKAVLTRVVQPHDFP